jgi:hypothetical protein
MLSDREEGTLLDRRIRIVPKAAPVGAFSARRSVVEPHGNA